MLVKKESMRKATAMFVPNMKIMGLNPIFEANLTPKESTEWVISPRKGNTIDIKESVTLGSYYFMYAAM
jgi:hypothetical protein